ncbi:hypothetical protein [Streptacidiphilus neutrinimicus]|uniref:hypothetical protein n=1 Tax=Streptacidiphilus neutrinimicus TaxID=105420 RepID=UPI001269F156|nr:hypothetical protein [Streptacidiphilus neutrinimicus]
MHATARRAASASLAVCAALALSTCHPGGSDGGAAPSSAARTSSTLSSPSSSASAESSPTTAASVVAASGSPCRDLVVTAAVKAEVTRTYAAQNKLVHIGPVPGSFLYGACGGVTYAASPFEPTAGATLQEQVASQDEGSVPKYFSLGAAGAWSYLGSAGFPATGGCIGAIPRALAAVWGDCRSH